MKKLAMLITALALTVVLASCGGEDVNYAEMYDAVLQKYHAYLQAPKDYADDISVGVCEIALAIYGQPPLENIGYTIEDLSGDGIPELVICGVQDNTDDVATGTFILGLYTLVESEPTQVFEGYLRNRYHYIGDGRLLNIASPGSSSTVCGIFRLSNDAAVLECEEYIFTYYQNEPISYELAVFRNTTGEWDKDVSEPSDYEHLESLMATPIKTLNLTPFTDYVPTVSGN